MSKCTVVIPLYNKAALTRHCLNLLFQRPETAEFDVVVVDDGSRDQTSRVVAEFPQRVRVVTHAVNCGFAQSCNDGAQAAQGEFLVFLNNDTEPQPGWLDSLVAYAESHPRVAMVGSKLLFPNDTIQHAGIVFGHDGHPRHIYTGFPAHHPAVNKSRAFQAVTGACVLIRRSLFAELGGFDNSYLNSYEDVDLCMRLAERGLEVHYCHESVLYHLESATRNSQAQQEDRNAQKFAGRWRQKIRPDELDYYVEDGLLTVHPPDFYPVKIEFSPLLGIQLPDETLTLERLLKLRTQQVQHLLQENVRLRVQLQEAELRAAYGEVHHANQAAGGAKNGEEVSR
jgi:GT2 family glycosyltransferase